MLVDYKVIGERIKEERLKKEITQIEMAEIMNVSRSFISKVECGNDMLNLKRLIQICEILNISLVYILTGTLEKKENYLAIEFKKVLDICTPNRKRAILEIAKIVSNVE